MTFITTQLDSENNLAALGSGDWNGKLIIVEKIIDTPNVVNNFSDLLSKKLETTKLKNCAGMYADSGALALMKASGVQIVIADKVENKLQIEAAKYGFVLAEKGKFMPVQGQKVNFSDIENLITWDDHARAIFAIFASYSKTQTESQNFAKVN